MGSKQSENNHFFSILEMNNEEGQATINMEGGLVHPDSVIQEFTKIGEAIPVFSSLDGKKIVSISEHAHVIYVLQILQL